MIRGHPVVNTASVMTITQAQVGRSVGRSVMKASSEYTGYTAMDISNVLSAGPGYGWRMT